MNHHTVIVFACFAVLKIKGVAVNLALNKPASQSSTPNYEFSSEAGNAVDGNSNGDWRKGSCAHTIGNMYSQWWMVDLLRDYNITAVTIVKRQDDHVDFLHDFVVETFGSNPSVFSEAQGSLCVQYEGIFPASDTLYCREPLIGRFVRISKSPTDSTSLMLCEVSVMGMAIQKVEECPGLRRRFVRSAGKRVMAKSIISYSSESRADCATKCYTREDCQAVNFDHMTKACNMIKDVLDTNTMVSEINWDLYYT